MLPPSPTTTTTTTTTSTPPLRSTSVQHNYGTRIRQNSIIKPSARLRQSPDPPPSSLKKSKLAAPHLKSHFADHSNTRQDFPVFPPPNVMLHPEDSNSKVFLAIGRSFFSVNNCAMTIKDLAEMTLKFGLVCQNVSAAGQAITTYIRTHLQRCETQQDHPLLLRHVLSGTASDDDLLPALHSRTGGAHCIANPENRTTNFRRGTMVWYLSKATGAPCPFARAGIQLCEYTENGRVGSHADARERKKERDRLRRLEVCGQKRKRLPRGCVEPDSDLDSENQPPPKVKLTLRLRPCFSATASSSGTKISSSSQPRVDESDSESSSISVDDSSDDDENSKIQQEQPWSLPPYPRRSISIPCYTPSIESPYQFPFTSSLPQPSTEPYRRSSSVPYSIASPPPNSEDEDDDYHISMTGVTFERWERITADTDADFDMESDCEGEMDRETQWESPGPRSPSAPLANGRLADIVVKQEPSDVKGILDAWGDVDFLGDSKMAAAALYAESTAKIKVEGLDSWDWQSAGQAGSSDGYPPILGLDESPNVKREDLDLDSRLSFLDDITSPLVDTKFDISLHMQPLSFSPTPLPERRHSEKWTDASSEQSWPVYSRALTSMSLPSLSSATSPSPESIVQPDQPKPELSTPFTVRPARELEPISSSSAIASVGQPTTVTSLEPHNDTIAPSWLIKPASEVAATELHNANLSNVVVHACQPCTPAVSATQIEGISVYQMTLGSSLLLRRIDTDFVNISPIATHLGLPTSSLSSIPNTVVVSKGSATVTGTWVPLASARAFLREHPLPKGILNIFLSDSLFERFPPALQDFHRTNAPGRLLNQFGPHFKSTTDMQRPSPLSVRTDVPLSLSLSLPLPLTLSLSRSNSLAHNRLSWAREPVLEWDVQNDSPIPVVQVLSEEAQIADTPLSATEQEMFHALCAMPDWEKENSPPVITSQQQQQQKVVAVEEPPIDILSDTTTAAPNAVAVATQPVDRPLRRSKRVANAMAVAARSRTRSCRRSARNSLS